MAEVEASMVTGVAEAGEGHRRRIDAYASICPAAAVVDLVLGAAVLVGWATGTSALTAFGPDMPTAKALAGLLLALAGVALLLWHSGRPARRVVARALGLAIAAVAGVTLLEYATGANLGIDAVIPVSDAPSAGAPYPGRMALHSAVGLSVGGLAIASLGTSWRRWHPAEILGLVAASVGAFDLLAYAYGAPSVRTIGLETQVALPVALGILALGAAVIAADDEHGLMRLIRDPGIAGRAARRILPTVLIVLPTAGWLEVVLQRESLVDDPLGTMAAVAAGVALVFAVAWWAISSARVTETELRRSEVRYRETLDDMVEGAMLIGSDWRYLFVNLAAARHGHTRREDVLGRTMQECYPGVETSEIFGYYRRCMSDRIPQKFEAPFTFPDGSVEWYSLSVEPVPEGIFVLSTDITDQRRLEEQLHQSQKMEAMGQLAGGIAHDFNNLLTAIRGYAELLDGELPVDAAAHDDLAEIVAASDRATELTQQLLAFGRRQVLQPRVIDPAEVVSGIAPMLRRVLGEQIELVTETRSHECRVRADRGQLEQVVVNLAVNARDAMPDGGRLTIETSRVDLDEAYVHTHPDVSPGPHVRLRVSDTGIGMDRATQARIFEPFFTTKAEGKGTGLGLASVHGFVRQSGGSVYVYSEPGRGTSFSIYMPRVEESERMPVVESPAEPVPAGSGTVLLVEDEPSVRALAERMLVGLGYAVVTAQDGDDALARAAADGAGFDLLLTDVTMPGMQGPELARRLTASIPGLRVLYVSGFAVEQLGTLELLPGTSLLAKPFTTESLGRAVRQALEAPPVD